MKNCRFFTLFGIILLIAITNAFECPTYSPPKIQPAFMEQYIKEFDDLKLTCYGEQPISWVIPKRTIGIKNPFFDPTSKRPYKQELMVRNVTRGDLGYYSCKYTNREFRDISLEEMEEKGLATRVYVYLNDPEDKVHNLRIFTGYPILEPDSPVIIDCRPTSPDIKVTINERVDDGVLDITDKFNYDDRIGFQAISDTEVERIAGYRCDFERNDKLIYFDLFPELNVKLYVQEGDTINLECMDALLKIDNYTLNWSYPAQSDRSSTTGNRITQSEKVIHGFTTYLHGVKEIKKVVLTVRNAMKSDSGTYQCIKQNIDESLSITNYYVDVYGSDEDFVEISTNNPNITVDKCSQERIIKRCMVCNIDAFPQPTVTWYNNNDDPIKFSTSSRKHTLEVSKSNISVMCIDNINEDDSGTYKVRVSTKKSSKILSYYLNVIDKTVTVLKTPTWKCGAIPNDHVELIRHGEETKPGEWPWHVALFQIDGPGSRKYICGGSLISEYKVVTAAHCVTSKATGKILPERILVVAGKPNLDSDDGEPQERSVYKITVHSNYKSSTLNYDIAILKLTYSIVFNNLIQPICLIDRKNYDRNDIINRYGTVVGWGLTETNEDSTSLLKARLPVVDDFKCLKSNPLFFQRFLFDYTYCAGFKNGTSVCNGDSGGGMYFRERVEDTDLWYLRGIVSLTVQQTGTNRCNPYEYTIFTDVTYFRDFIDNTP